MKLWRTSKPFSSELKLHRLWYRSVLVLIAVGLSAQVPIAGPDLPSNKQVIAFLTESIDWYRHCAMKRQIAIDPVDLAFVDAHRQDAAQILQLSFDFARADAQFSTMSERETHKDTSAFATGSPDLAQFVKLEDNTELQRRETSKEIEEIKNRLETLRGNNRRELQAALDATQSRLDVLNAGLATLRQSVEFVRAFTSRESEGLASAIDDFARTVPDVTNPTRVESQVQNSPPIFTAKPHDSGILALSSEVSALGTKISILDDEIQRTDKLRQSSDALRGPLLASINKRLPAVGENALQARDLAELERQKTSLDELAALIKALSPAIIALDKQRVLLAAYESHLSSWRAAVTVEHKKRWNNLLSRLLGATVVIGALVAIGRVVRRATRRRMRNTDRRHVVLVIQRVILWATIVGVTAFAFASDFTSLATFFGLLAAGLAVALQSVIIAALAYFVLVGRRGIRIGDRVEISSVIGDVMDIGWLQFQLREIDKGTRQPTGRMVTFSNSFVFLSPATALSRFSREI
jgi:Mechanosensitive ion channel